MAHYILCCSHLNCEKHTVILSSTSTRSVIMLYMMSFISQIKEDKVFKF